MNYDLIVTRIPDNRTRGILARHLAGGASLAFDKAVATLDSLPAVYLRNLSKAETANQIRGLQRLGVAFRVAESGGPEAALRAAVSPPVAQQAPAAKASTPSAGQHAPPPDALSEILDGVSRNNPPRKVAAAASRPQMSNARPMLPHQRQGGIAITAASAKRKTGPMRVLGVLAILCLAGLSVWLAAKAKKFSVGEVTLTTSQQRQSTHAPHANTPPAASAPAAAQDGKQARGYPVTGDDRASSAAYADSAASYASNLDKAIKFYQLAVAFNRYNANAWYGLINAYHNAGRNAEAASAQTKMQEFLGADVFSLAKIVAPYGAVDEFENGTDGAFRLKYRTHASNRAGLTEETFLIMRALRLRCKCQTIVVYAETGTGSGMLAQIAVDQFPETLDAYEHKANISYSR